MRVEGCLAVIDLVQHHHRRTIRLDAKFHPLAPGVLGHVAVDGCVGERHAVVETLGHDVDLDHNRVRHIGHDLAPQFL